MEQSPELFRQFLEDRLPPVFSRAQLYDAVDKLMFTPKSMINYANRGIGPKFFYMGIRVMYEKASFIEPRVCSTADISGQAGFTWK